MSELTRRDFLKGSVGLAGVAAGVALLPDPRRAHGQEIQKEEWVLHWDGTWKRLNVFPGTKFIPIPGLGENWQSTTLNVVKEKAIYHWGFDQHDVLDPTYRINTGNPLLGEPYDKSDSTQNPQYSLYNMHKLMEKYEQDFPQDKFWLIGHSQGGYLAYELALMHRDRVEGVVTLNGALKGADIVPSSIDTALAPVIAPIIGGEAGSYYLKRAADATNAQQVERNILRLRMIHGMTFVTLASTNDMVVSDKFAFASNSDQVVGGTKLIPRFPMEELEESPSSQHVESQFAVLDDNLSLSPVEKQEVKRKIKGGYFGHVAVTRNRLVLIQLQHILQFRVSSLANPQALMAKGEDNWRREMKIVEEILLIDSKAVANMIRNALPYQGSHFTLSSDHLTIDMNITSKDEDGFYEELNRFLTTNGVEVQSKALRRLLRVRQS